MCSCVCLQYVCKGYNRVPHTTLCQLQEVKVLRNLDLGTFETEDTARLAMHNIEESNVSLPER